MKKKTVWYLIAALILGLAVLAVGCASSTTPSAPAAPATPVAPAAPAEPATPATPVAAPPTAPKAMHEAQFAADPPACATCHTVGAPGVGVPGGMGLPGPESGANDHTDRTKATPLQCKACHQLSA